MLELVKIRRGFWQRPTIRFFYYALMGISLFCCMALYVFNFIQVWGVPTTQVQDQYVVEVTRSAVLPLEDTSVPSWENGYNGGRSILPSPDIYQKMLDAQAVNPEVKGWIQIDGTNIDHPVVQASDNEKYLRTDPSGKYRFTGSIFADYRDDLSGDRNDLSRNTVIYGHNINIFNEEISGEMFAQLLRFTDLNFASEHQYFTFATPTDQMTWEIFAVYYTDTGFNFNNVSPGNETVFSEIITEAQARSLFQYGVEVSPEDKIITLSTCSYKYTTEAEQRFVVMARLVKDTSQLLPKEVTLNPTPKPPVFTAMAGAIPGMRRE